MRAYLLCTARLAAAMLSGGIVLGQARAEGLDVPPGRGSEITGGGAPKLPPGRSSGFDRDGLWAAPGEAPAKKAQASAAATAEQLKQALAPKPAPETVRKQKLDALFVRLRNAGSQEDAQRIAASIARVWLQSDSDTANLLMQRALVSMQARQYPLALSLFDKLVAVEPDWAEAWNQRATTRFLTGDMDGAMADVSRVMKLEPRHFGALAGMGMILQEEGFDKRALEIFKQALAIYPLAPDIQKLVEKLTREVDGQDI